MMHGCVNLLITGLGTSAIFELEKRRVPFCDFEFSKDTKHLEHGAAGGCGKSRNKLLNRVGASSV